MSLNPEIKNSILNSNFVVQPNLHHHITTSFLTKFNCLLDQKCQPHWSGATLISKKWKRFYKVGLNHSKNTTKCQTQKPNNTIPIQLRNIPPTTIPTHPEDTINSSGSLTFYGLYYRGI